MAVNISYEIKRLIQYGIQNTLIYEEDRIYIQNQILEVLNLDTIEDIEVEYEKLSNPQPILDNILKWAYTNNFLESNSVVFRDLLDTNIMNCLIPMPSQVIRTFNNLYQESSEEATNYYYSFSKLSNYIRAQRIGKNVKWKTRTEYGDLDITINLSKPEKDPKAIEKARTMKPSEYLKCLLCKENEGYAGRINHPARQNHRIIPIVLNGEEWFLQYSPYVYYKEHCIVLKDKHTPMMISKDTFKELLDFVNKFPHYTVGSNADLPLVGGSILSHAHFQGGRHEFPMAKAIIEEEVIFSGFEDITSGIVKWPMSVIRLAGEDLEKLASLSHKILTTWKEYTDTDNDILAYTKGIAHNTVTPIARKRNDKYEIDIVLRNNRTNERYPYGIFHPHEEIHHIKKENIGLIEVMGLAVLPGRLKDELEALEYCLLNSEKEKKILDNEALVKHIHWFKELKEKYKSFSGDNVQGILKNEVGRRFLSALEHAGVFKRTSSGKEGFKTFIAKVNEG